MNSVKKELEKKICQGKKLSTGCSEEDSSEALTPLKCQKTDRKKKKKRKKL